MIMPSRIGVVVCVLSGAFAAAPTPLSTSADGKAIFRFETFGNEDFWTDSLRLNRVIEASLDPSAALWLGLKLDADALPPGMLATADFLDPATMVALLKSDAVVGVKATVDDNQHITRMGVTCALCHSTVDNSVEPGIGRRLDGWPNRDLDLGAIIALSSALPPAGRIEYLSWGRGKYELKGIRNNTYTAEDSVSYCANFVGVTEAPILMKEKLAALREYQNSLEAPIAVR